MKITAIDTESPLFGHVRPGYTLLSVNGEEVQDEIDFRFRTADERVEIVIVDSSGRKHIFRFKAGEADDRGLTFDDQTVKVCNCNCIFCFVHQQPKGMRRALYVKDEDYRLSFTHGNFVTLSNVTDADIERIIRQRLSPLYVSVHATDDKLRRCMLGNEKLAPILPQLKYLTENGIEVHTQVVLCPGINDAEPLDQTITQLVELYPGVKSLAVVPVGLTKYRDRLSKLRPYDAKEGAAIIDRVEDYQRWFLKANGSRFVWAADEFYVLAGRDFPGISSYEEMSQFENGIGMAREFITGFNRRKAGLRRLVSSRCAVLLTGESASPFLGSRIIPYLRNELDLAVTFHEVSNRFWGETVTVSGLLTGQDLLRSARENCRSCDVVVLPPNCLNQDDLFLDNMSLDQFRQVLEVDVVVGSYDLVATIREVFV